MTDFLEADGQFIPVAAIARIYASTEGQGAVFVHCGGDRVELPLVLALPGDPADVDKVKERESQRAVRELLQVLNHVQAQPTGTQQGAHVISYAGTARRPVNATGQHWRIERLPLLR